MRLEYYRNKEIDLQQVSSALTTLNNRTGENEDSFEVRRAYYHLALNGKVAEDDIVDDENYNVTYARQGTEIELSLEIQEYSNYLSEKTGLPPLPFTG